MLTAITVRVLQMSPQFVISAGLPYGLGSSGRDLQIRSSSAQAFSVYLRLSHFSCFR